MKIISLFSGAGGLDLGLIQAGHDVVWANDVDADCVETYRLNISNHCHLADIRKVDPSRLPLADMVVGGFPCQGFSLANLRRAGDDERNLLYREFLRVLRVVRPKYFIAENVRGILSLEGGEAFKHVLGGFRRTGYRVHFELLNFANFGVPQTRQRVLIVGTRKDLPEAQAISLPPPTHARVPSSGLLSWVSVGEALADIPDPDSEHELKNHVFSQYKVTNRNFTGHRRTDPDKPSPTILARGNGKGGVCALMHPNNHRRLSVRESARIQTFPDDFEFVGKLGSCYRQIGNAVPPLFARVLGEHIGKLTASKENSRCA